VLPTPPPVNTRLADRTTRLTLAAAWLTAALALAAAAGWAQNPAPRRPPAQLVPAVEEGRWIRPARSDDAEPVWGLKDGIAVGLWPASGPRGLLRVYTPYLGQQRPRMINYISVEPVVKGVRGQSELEVSQLTGRPGLGMSTASTLAAAAAFRQAGPPDPGRIERRDGTETLTFFITMEPFRNGARPILQVTLRADRPREIACRIYSAEGGVAMNSCVLSATMGNYGRLRRLWLREGVVDAPKLWPTFQPDRLGFALWRQWNREAILKRGGYLIVAATPDEADPASATYDADVPPHWRYQGKWATQYWRARDRAGTVTRVNGRITYWGGVGRIPGGISYENFEMEAPFTEGQEWWFGVTPEEPQKLGFTEVD